MADPFSGELGEDFDKNPARFGGIGPRRDLAKDGAKQYQKAVLKSTNFESYQIPDLPPDVRERNRKQDEQIILANDQTGQYARNISFEPIRLSYYGDLGEAKPKSWLIKNVIARGEISTWFAPPGFGKSGLLTDIFAHGACDASWRGYRIKNKFGGLYFALERMDLVKRRFVAHRLRDNLPADLPIAISGDVIDLMNRSCVERILDAIKRAEDRFGCEIGVLGFDTWAKGIAAGQGDEIQAKDQNAALANLRRVLERASTHIATIGHTGKDESRGERGSNAKKADVDLEVQISGKTTIKSAVVTKANDQPLGLMTTFQLEPFDFGVDDDGDVFRTFIVGKQSIAAAAAAPERKLSDKQQLALEALAETILQHGVILPARYGLPAGLKAVTTEQWMGELYSKGVLQRDAKNPFARFSELRNQLHRRRLIGVRDDLNWPATTLEAK